MKALKETVREAKTIILPKPEENKSPAARAAGRDKPAAGSKTGKKEE